MIGIDNIFDTEAKLHKIMQQWFTGIISKLDIFKKKLIFQDISENSERTLNIL